MPYAIYNPWDRLPPAGYLGTFRRWSSMDVQFGRWDGASGSSTSFTTRTVLRRYEGMFFVATGYAGGSVLSIGATSGLTFLGRFRDTPSPGVFLKPSSGAATAEFLQATWQSRPTAALAAYSQALPHRFDGGTLRIVGLTSGATTAVAWTNAPASGYIAAAPPYVYWQTGPTEGQWAENAYDASSLRLQGFYDDPPNRRFLSFWRFTWQAGPSRYPLAAGSDLAPTALTFPTGFQDGETVRLEVTT